MTRHFVLASGPTAKSRGFTLIELMVSVTVGLLVIAALTSVLLSNSATNRSDSRTSELQSAARYALEYLKRDLQSAGFRATTAVSDFTATAGSISAVTGDCVAGGGMVTNLAQPVWGTTSTNPFSATCIPATDYLAGDVLVIRSISGELARFNPAAPVKLCPACDPALAYLRLTYDRADFFMGSATPPDYTAVGKTPYTDHQLVSTVYHVRPYTTSSSENPRVPALWRLVLGKTPAGQLGWNAEMVASGVENLQAQYGMYETDGSTRFFPADQVAPGTNSTATTGNWQKISTVKVNMLVRSTTAEPGYSNTTTYNLGNSSITVNDGFRRQLSAFTINLRNY